jgi:hypothetical protein
MTMIEFSQILQAYNAIADGIKALAGTRRRKSAHYEAALLRVYTAANESRSYIAGLKNRKQPDAARETMIARLWSEAAVNLRKIDRKLADQCLVFGSSISESTRWSNAEVDAARKSVTEIFEQARKLL